MAARRPAGGGRGAVQAPGLARRPGDVPEHPPAASDRSGSEPQARDRPAAPRRHRRVLGGACTHRRPRRSDGRPARGGVGVTGVQCQVALAGGLAGQAARGAPGGGAAIGLAGPGASRLRQGVPRRSEPLVPGRQRACAARGDPPPRRGRARRVVRALRGRRRGRRRAQSAPDGARDPHRRGAPLTRRLRVPGQGLRRVGRAHGRRSHAAHDDEAGLRRAGLPHGACPLRGGRRGLSRQRGRATAPALPRPGCAHGQCASGPRRPRIAVPAAGHGRRRARARSSSPATGSTRPDERTHGSRRAPRPKRRP